MGRFTERWTTPSIKALAAHQLLLLACCDRIDQIVRDAETVHNFFIMKGKPPALPGVFPS
jgi:hypothetical protein